MATAYICPMCVFNCDNLPDLEQHLEAHESNALQSPVKQQPHATKAVRSSPLYAKAPASSTNRSPVQHSHSLANSSPNKTYERRYACKSCPFSTHSVKAYFNHRQVAHGEQLLITECPFCDYASQYPGKVKKHLTDEHPMQQTPNDEAPVQSTRSSARGNSINNTIEQNGKTSLDAAGTKFTDCPFCSFTSNDSDAFRQHVLTNHLSDKNFRCLVCNRLYRYRGDCSYHIRKKHSDRMIGDNLESLREYIGEFQPNTMSIHELKELLACPLTPSLASIPSNGTPTQVRQPLPQQSAQPPTNSTHGFRCGYCTFSSANSGDVKKHQTWKHAHQPSNILPIDPNDAAQQAVVSSKRKRVQSTKLTYNDEDGPVVRRPRISMPAQRQLTIDTSAAGNGDHESAPRDLLSPNEPTPSAMDFELASKKSSTPTHQPSVTASTSSRIYKCLRCERLAPHRWIIERHIRAKHPSDSDTLDEVIVEIEKPSTPASTNGEPKMATKASLASEPDNASSPVPKAFSCSACSLQSYNLWVILRHIRNVHENDGSNAKIIDNINNQIIEDNDDRSANSVSSNTPTTTASTDENDESESQRNETDNEEMLKHLINTAMASRKANAPNAFLENLPASLANNNVAASLATLLGQLTNKQLLQQQQQCQAEKAPLAKRYKCSLCSHVSAWGGNVKKHLKRMHPGDYSGHVIDLGAELAADEAIGNRPPSLSTGDELDEPQILSTNTNKLSLANDKTRHSYPQSLDLINTKLKDIDNSPSFAPPTSTNSSQSTRPERLYGCSACSYECTNPSNIHRHVEVHCGEDGGGFQCSQCFFLSKWRASIRKHMISAHGSSLASLTNVLEPLIISKSADATAVVKKWLIHENGNKHEDDPNNNSTHTVDASTYYCASCPYTNNNRASFEQHVVNHSVPKRDDDTHPCSFCTFNSAEKEAFDDHQMLHILKEDFHDDVTANAVENTVV